MLFTTITATTPTTTKKPTHARIPINTMRFSPDCSGEGYSCLRGVGSRCGRLRGCFCCPLQIRQFRHGVDCKNRQRSGQPQEKRTEQRYRIPFPCHAVFPHFPMFFPYFITKQDGKHDRFITIFGYASVRAKTSAKTSPNNSPEYKASSKVFTSVPNSTRRELWVKFSL